METLLLAMSVTLFLLANLTMVLLVRDVFAFLGPEDQSSLRNYWTVSGWISVWRKRDRAIRNAWNEHVKQFPKSRKRILFGVLLCAAILSMMSYPLWLAFGSQ